MPRLPIERTGGDKNSYLAELRQRFSGKTQDDC